MDKQLPSSPKGAFNGWILTGLIIHGLVLYGFWLNVQELGVSEGFISWLFTGLLALGGLIYIGALALLLGQKRLGAILVIISGFSLIPIGAISAIGGFRVLRQLEESAIPENPLFQAETTPDQEIEAAHYGPGFGLGFAALIGGLFVLVGLGQANGVALIGFGLLYIVLGVSTKNSTIELYPSYWKVKYALSGWQRIPYEDIHDLKWEKKFLAIHYQYGDKQKSIALNPAIWGKAQVENLRELLHLKVQTA
jgi:hypothetical protein